MKKLVALLLTVSMCAAFLVPFGTLGVSASAESGEDGLPADGTVLYEETFSDTASDTAATIAALNKTADTYSLADWSVLAGSSSGALTLSGGALNVNATSDLLVQVFAGDTADLLAKDRDYTVSFDMTYTGGAADDFAGLRFHCADTANYIETAVRLRGNGYLTACSGGTKYSLEDDGVKATAAEVKKGTSSYGHVLHALNKTSGTTLLTLLNGTDSSISAAYASGTAALKDKTLHYSVESIHGAGVIVSINGVVVSTTVKNVYYYDLLSGLSGRIALYFSAGTMAKIDNLRLKIGGAFTVSTNSMGIKVMSVNTLFSTSSGTEPNDIYSMHWLVDENGTLRMEALMEVIRQQSPDIVGFQERSYTLPSGSGQENTIVETMIAMGYGIIANKMRNNSVDMYGNPPSRYDSYNWTPIFYKTSKFVLMNDSNRETEYVRDGLGVNGITDERVANGSLVFAQSSKDMNVSVCDYTKTYTVRLLIGAQKDAIDTALYEAVTVRYLGRCYGENASQKTAVEMRYRTDDPTDIRPVTLTDTAGWLDVSLFSDTELGKVTYNAGTGMVEYGGKSYTGAYYNRYETTPVAVLLTNYEGTIYNPDSTLYSTFDLANKYGPTVFPCGYTAKNVTELRYKSKTAEHNAYAPVTLTEQQLTSGRYLNATYLTQVEYDSVVFAKDGTTKLVYNGTEYDGMYYVRSEMTAIAGEGDSKSVTWGVLKLRGNGQLILAMNTHCALLLGYQQQLSDGAVTAETAKEWRIDNARQILEVTQKVYAKYGELPTFITGDFNMGNSDPMYTVLSEIFDDAARLAPNTVYWEYSHHTPGKITAPTGGTDSYGNPTFYYKEVSADAYPVPAYPIDHIFTTADDFRVLSYNVLNDVYDENGDLYDYGSFELHMTDHCALVAEMEVTGVSTPGCSHDNGVYREVQRVTLSAANALDTIYYTTDGTNPVSSATRKIYTGTFDVYGDVQLRAVSFRAGVYSLERRVNFALCGELAITEIICNPSGYDILEGFEVVNTSDHSVDLGDYMFWCLTNNQDAAGLADGAFDYTYNITHMRINEKGRYIVAPGEVYFIWTVMDDAYKWQLNYADGASAYAVEFVTPEGLDSSESVSLWESLGYTELNADSVGKVIYRTDLVSEAFFYQTGSVIPAERIVPLDKTTAVSIFPDGKGVWDGFARKDMPEGQIAPKILSQTFNMANSVYSRLFITYDDELTPENAFATAVLDNTHGAAAGISVNVSTKVPSVKEGSFTMMPALDEATGRITSTATAFNAWAQAKNEGSGFSVGRLNASGAESQVQDVSSFVSRMDAQYHYIEILAEENTACYVAHGSAVHLPAAPAGDGVFVGWRASSGALYAADHDYIAECDNTFTPFFLGFATLAGASVRTTAGSTGLRFLSTLDKAGYEELLALTGEVNMGTFIVPQFYVENAGGFDVGRFPKYLNVAAKGFYEESADTYTLAGSVANIYMEHYRMAYAACGYLSFTYADGAAALIYAAFPADGARTVCEVATAAYTDRAVSPSEQYPYETEQGDYSPYTEAQREVMYGFFSDEVHIAFVNGDFVATGHSKEAFTWVYDDNADLLTFTRTDGADWRVTALYLDGEETAFTVNGDQLVVRISFYTDLY